MPYHEANIPSHTLRQLLHILEADVDYAWGIVLQIMLFDLLMAVTYCFIFDIALIASPSDSMISVAISDTSPVFAAAISPAAP